MASIPPSQEASASDSAAAATPLPPPSPEFIYAQLAQYPFDADREYQEGLATILGHPDTPVTPAELADQSRLLLQAQCFYFSRRFHTPPIDPVGYSTWLQSQGQSSTPPNMGVTAAPPPPPSSSSAEPSTSPPAPTGAEEANATGPDPPYPTSFAAIVELITRNLPVPGIEEIPPTVLDPGSSKIDRTPRRKKPWEKDADVDPDAEAEAEPGKETAAAKENATLGGPEGSLAADGEGAEEGIDINGHKETGQGVVKILQPNAIPASGLLSND